MPESKAAFCIKTGKWALGPVTETSSYTFSLGKTANADGELMEPAQPASGNPRIIASAALLRYT